MQLGKKVLIELWYISDEYRKCFLVIIIRQKFRDRRFRKRENFSIIRKINIEADFLIQYVHAHFLEITQLLKRPDV